MIKRIKRARRNFSRMNTAEQAERVDAVGGTIVIGSLMIWILWIAVIWMVK
jgi:hypothetical protein